MTALELMADVGVENSYFYIGQEDQSTSIGGAMMSDMKSGIFNVALFLTQAVVNSVRDDGCDEHNTQIVNGRHPLSNSCGQYGVSYQDLVCTEAGDVGKECPLDPSMTITAATRALDLRYVSILSFCQLCDLCRLAQLLSCDALVKSTSAVHLRTSISISLFWILGCR
jgi:hypothetical protein